MGKRKNLIHRILPNDKIGKLQKPFFDLFSFQQPLAETSRRNGERARLGRNQPRPRG